MKKLKDILLELREENKWSQSELAAKLNVSKSTISMWERGERYPQRAKMEEIADLFNVDLDYLYEKTDIRKRVSFDADGNTYISAPEYSQDMVEMIYLFSKLTGEQKKSILSLMRSFCS